MRLALLLVLAVLAGCEARIRLKSEPHTFSPETLTIPPLAGCDPEGPPLVHPGVTFGIHRVVVVAVTVAVKARA